jgi:hypothetical protein
MNNLYPYIYMDKPFYDTFWPLVICVCTFDQQQKIYTLYGLSNEHSYQVSFQWFLKRRLKCKSLRMMMPSTDDNGHQVIQYLT